MADPASLDRAARLLEVVRDLDGGAPAAEDALKALARGGVIVPEGAVQRLAERLARLPDAELALLSEDLAFNDALRLLKVARMLPRPGGTQEAETALRSLADGGDVVPAGPLRDVLATIRALPPQEAAQISADLAAPDGGGVLRDLASLPGGLPTVAAMAAELARGGRIILADDVDVADRLSQMTLAQTALMADPNALSLAVRLVAAAQGVGDDGADAVEALRMLRRGGVMLPPPPPPSRDRFILLAKALSELSPDLLRTLAEGPPIAQIAQLAAAAPADKFEMFEALASEAGALPGGLSAAGDALSSLAAGGRIAEAGPLSAALAELETLPPADRDRFAADRGIHEAATFLAALAKLDAPQREAAVAAVAQGDLSGALALAPLVAKLGRTRLEAVVREADVSAGDRLEQALGQARARIADAVGAKLSAVVARSEGVVDVRDGSITFSRETLFRQGEDAVGPAQARVLDDICEPWIEALCSVSDVIGEIRIEGHASSEWDADSEPVQAYLSNLELSQKRASSVLEYCLGKISGPTATADWARGRMVAIGHSSSRIIRDPATGLEDKDLSRRVVLRPDIDRDLLLDQDAGSRRAASACNGG